MNEKWYKSVVVLLGTIMLLIQAITVVYMVGINPSTYDKSEKIMQAIVSVAIIIVLIIFMVLSLKKKKAGPILGMIFGLAYVYKFNIPSLLTGVAFFIFSLGLLVELEKNVEPEKVEEKPKKAKKIKKEEVKETA